MSADTMNENCRNASGNVIGKAICVIKTGLESHLNNRSDYMNADLLSVFPAGVEIKIEDGVTSIQNDTAQPQITVTRDALIYTPKNANSVPNTVRFDITSALKLEVSTGAKTITDNLVIEICSYLCMLLKPLQKMGIRILRITASPVTQNRPAHANFYISTILVPLELPSVMWQNKYLEGKLRETRFIPDILFLSTPVEGSEECLKIGDTE